MTDEERDARMKWGEAVVHFEHCADLAERMQRGSTIHDLAEAGRAMHECGLEVIAILERERAEGNVVAVVAVQRHVTAVPKWLVVDTERSQAVAA